MPHHLPCRTIGLLLALAVGTATAEEPRGWPANRLANETSPYLLQHAHNPVDWYPWGPEAFEKARETGRPIFLSVGYSACYWCHVMERECFENEAIARTLNERFVCIKVDREERPDVDAVYMAALQAMTGQGGWPMSIFATPDGRPFYGGTYFPPAPREGMPSFPTVLDGVADAWRDERAEVEKSANRLADAIRRSSRALGAGPEAPLSLDLAVACQQALAEQYDRDFGGFGFDVENPRRPKFPEPSNLLFLLDRHRRRPADPVARSIERANPRLKGPDPLSMTQGTLDAMARGGIRDHLGGGYHRYSTDRGWNVPHFEKMLYDNAQLASVFLEAYETTDDPRWRTQAEDIFGFVARELTDPDGGFYSTIDAETEGEEGAYYVWKSEEVATLLGDDFKLFARVYGLDRPPNFEGERHVLRRMLAPAAQAEALDLSVEGLEATLAPLRARLLEARSRRPRPRLDDKILTSWNGLMIAALADGYRVLDDARYRQAAEKAADFLLSRHRTPEGRLLRTSRGGEARLAGYLEDYAFLAWGLLRLHNATGEARWLDEARALADRMLAEFQDERGGFYFTARDHEALLARLKDPYDNALPGGNSVAIESLLALADATKKPAYREAAGKALRAFSAALQQTPTGAPRMLVGLMRYLDERPEANLGPAAAIDQPGSAGPNVLETGVEILSPFDPRPGDILEVALTLTIAGGWHLTAPGGGSDRFSPVRVRLAPGAPGSILDVEYPEGAAMPDGAETTPPRVYTGSQRVRLRLRLPDELEPGPRTIPLVVHYQACNDRACLAPAVREVNLKLDIAGPRGEGRR